MGGASIRRIGAGRTRVDSFEKFIMLSPERVEMISDLVKTVNLILE